MPGKRTSTTRRASATSRRSSTSKGGARTTRRSAGTRSVPRAVSSRRSVWKSPTAQKGMYRFTYNDTNFGDGLVAVSAYSNYHTFRANSLYDPDKTGVGIQPYGYDNLMGAAGSALFNIYRVYAAKITVYFQRLVTNPDTTNTTSSLRLAIVPTVADPLSYVEFNDITRMPYTKTNLIRTTDETATQKTSCYVKMKQLRPLGVDAEVAQAAYNNNPTGAVYFQVHWDGAGTITADSTVNYDVKIKYYAKLWKQQDVNES